MIVDIKIDVKNLKRAVQNCNLGMGTYENPIAADYFAVNLDSDNYTIYTDKTDEINFKISNKKETKKMSSLELLDVFIYPTGKEETVLSDNNIKGLFNTIFKCDSDYIHNANRQLCITTNKIKNECILPVNNLSKLNMDSFFFTYRILFKLKIGKTSCCFSIDPFFRVRSRRRK